jgi:CheY-like chemotaxis protein
VDNGLSKLKILVADPSSHMSGLVSIMLRSLKVHSITEVHTGAAVVAELGRRVSDVLVLDDRLPGIDAIELVQKLRNAADNPNRLIAIIMMSATPDAARIAHARDAGVTEFLRKPFAAQHIETRLLAIQSAPRDFIAAPAYAGPDRRRRTNAAAPKRRAIDGDKPNA